MLNAHGGAAFPLEESGVLLSPGLNPSPRRSSTQAQAFGEDIDGIPKVQPLYTIFWPRCHFYMLTLEMLPELARLHSSLVLSIMPWFETAFMVCTRWFINPTYWAFA